MKKIALWIISVFLVLMSLGVFSSGGVLSGFLLLASGVISNPKTLRILEKKNKKPSKKILMAFVIFGFILGIALSPNTESKQEQKEVPEEQALTETVSEDDVAVQDIDVKEVKKSEPTKKTDAIVKVEEVTAIVKESGVKEIDLVSTEMQVHFIDVGQGDATLITCDGHSMLIDAGDNNKGTTVQLYLTKQGVTSLDYVIGTHPDADHFGGLDVVLYKFDCKTIIMPELVKDTKTYDDVIQTMKNKNYKNTSPIVGTTYQLGDASFTIIAPNNYDYGGNTNNYSVGILLKHGEKSFLFTGDAEEEAEKDMVNNKIEIAADVLKVGHHGSKSSSSTDFLNKVKPTYAVISCGEGNSYGHPQAATLNSLRSMGVNVFRTDEQGSIIATSNGTEITWNCSPSETWQAGESTESATPKKTSDKADTTTVKPQAKEVIATPIIEPSSVINTTTTYIINTNTKKFHLPSCRYVNSIKPENYLESTESRDAIAQQYDACKVCNP